MVVTPEQAGTYRQIAHRLRNHPATGPHRESERIGKLRREGGREWFEYDGDLLVELYEGDQVDVEMLLRQRAIERYTPEPEPAVETPEPRRRPRGGE